MNYLNFERFAWKTGSSRRKRWRWTSGYSWTEGRSRRKRLIKIRKLRKCALFYENFNNLGDIGGRCSECSPGYKGDKGERGYDGIPGPIGKRSHSICTKLCWWFMVVLVFFLKSGKKLWIVLYVGCWCATAIMIWEKNSFTLKILSNLARIWERIVLRIKYLVLCVR